VAPRGGCTRRRRSDKIHPVKAPLAALGAAALLTLSGVAGAAGGGSSLPLRAVALLELPGPASRFDYQSIDPKTHLLWIAHMNADELLAFDLRRGKVVKRIPAPGVHGVIAVPSIGRVFASATNARQILTIDARTGKVLARTRAGGYPDGLAYDPVERHVFVSDEADGVETVITSTGRLVTNIPLGGEAGNVQYDAVSRRILVDVQSRGELAVIDPKTNRIVRRVPLGGCSNDHSLYVDSPRRLAFIACDVNAVLLTLDLRSMRVTGRAGVGAAPDVLAFDPTLHRLYVSSESGEVAAFAETADGLRKLGQDFLATEAHTVAVDAASHLVYFPLQGPNGSPHLLIMSPVQ
jgi:DNA-binding beta-propeller fold protein YncE